MDDGWIDWNGGTRPVDVGVRVFVKFRGKGKEPVAQKRAVKADKLDWSRIGREHDIVAYRLAPVDPEASGE